MIIRCLKKYRAKTDGNKAILIERVYPILIQNNLITPIILQQPIEIIITPEQYIINELKKQQEWIIDLQNENEMKQRKKKK